MATKLARYTYFGENVLAHSTYSGGADKHPLDHGDEAAAEKLMNHQLISRESGANVLIPLIDTANT